MIDVTEAIHVALHEAWPCPLDPEDRCDLLLYARRATPYLLVEFAERLAREK